MQKLMIIGNLSEDASVVELASGMNVMNFNVAVNEKVKGEKKTTWYRAAKFGNDISILPFLKKGTKVFLSGKPDIEQYTNNAGEAKANQKIIVFEIELLGSAQGATETQQAPIAQAQTGTAQAQPESSEEPDDLPF
jgi:single-strand DNA-binding protein